MSITQEEENENKLFLNAIFNNDIEFIRTKIRNGFDIIKPFLINDNKYKYLIEYVIWSGYDSIKLQIAELLIENGTNIHVIDDNGNSILHSALHMRWPNTFIFYLINKGVNINIIDKSDRKIITYALWFHYDELALYLINNTLDISSRDNVGNSIILEVCTYSNIESLNAILKRGASINDINEFGNNTLLRAIYSNNDDSLPMIINKIIELGIDIHFKNKAGNNVLETALRFRTKEIVELILNHGACPHISDELSEAIKIVSESAEKRKLLDLACESDFKRNHMTLQRLCYIKCIIRNDENVYLIPNYIREECHEWLLNTPVTLFDVITARIILSKKRRLR